jgi:2-polyprenyl-3-methyl-5-hydroxy-6-metoxy-1,4-benzoquinol methylase
LPGSAPSIGSIRTFAGKLIRGTRTELEHDIHLDPVQAYDRIASAFEVVSNRRRAYLEAIDRLVIHELPPDSRTLLDVGAGTGSRALRIASASGITDPVLLEPSATMRGRWPAGVRAWPIRAEELGEKQGSFDVILCLWNVLGHIFPSEARAAVLRECGRLLSAQGRLFIDVNHRYNAAHYGILPTAYRFLFDLLRPNVENGDVVVRWNVAGNEYVTEGHVFTDAEFRRLTASAGLTVRKRINVSYATGEVCGPLAGNPLYILSRA